MPLPVCTTPDCYNAARFMTGPTKETAKPYCEDCSVRSELRGDGERLGVIGETPPERDPNAGMRVVVLCRCAWTYTYPIEVDRQELRCPNPECSQIPLDDGGQAVALVPEDDPVCTSGLQAVLNDDSGTPV